MHVSALAVALVTAPLLVAAGMYREPVVELDAKSFKKVMSKEHASVSPSLVFANARWLHSSLLGKQPNRRSDSSGVATAKTWSQSTRPRPSLSPRSSHSTLLTATRTQISHFVASLESRASLLSRLFLGLPKDPLATIRERGRGAR